MVEGACVLVLIVTIGLGTTLLVFNTGISIFFRNKLSMVTTEAAQYAAKHQSDPSVEQETRLYVKALLPLVGLNADLMTVKVAHVVAGEQVTIVKSFPLFGTYGFHLPTQIRLDDTEFCSMNNTGAN